MQRQVGLISFLKRRQMVWHNPFNKYNYNEIDFYFSFILFPLSFIWEV